MRIKPEKADPKLFIIFEHFCEREGIGIEQEDWEPWWICFETGATAVLLLQAGLIK